MIALRLCRLVTATFVLLLIAGCATTAHVAECIDPPQKSPEQPEYVQHPDRLLQETLSTSQRSLYRARRSELKTLPLYHDILLHPRATLDASIIEGGHKDVNVDAPIFLLGFEKPRANAPKHVNSDNCEGRDFELRKLPNDIVESVCDTVSTYAKRPMLLTHIAAIDGVSTGRYGATSFLYNAYDQPIAKAVESAKGLEGDDALYENALGALGSLAVELRRAMAANDITDVVVLSTGWNTRQRETLYNTMDWIAQIGFAHAKEGRAYRPLYLTISWQSAWQNPLLNAMKANVTTIGNDADELGLTWVNRLVHDVVIPAAAERDVAVTLVGHSYGTRVLGTALYLRDAVRRPPRGKVPSTAFIALQPAFPINRYGTIQGKERWFAVANPHAIVVLTSSVHDGANSFLPVGRYAGGGGSRDRVLTTSGNLGAFGCEILQADASGQVSDLARLTRDHPHLVSADEFISCRMPNTGGGAHSDVFDAAAGQLIANVMDAASDPKAAHSSRSYCAE